MKFKATIEQAKQIAVNAVNASSPMGMGFLHFESKNYTANDLNICPDYVFDGKVSDKSLPFKGDSIDLDYFYGRMVKLYMDEIEPGVWEVPDHEPRSDYQSWAAQYPTYKSLIESVEGVEILNSEVASNSF